MMLFIYDWIPNGIFHIIFIVGIVGSLISAFLPTIPFIGAYQWLFKVIAVACLCVGLVWYGIDSDEVRWKARNQVAEQKISELEKKAPIITEKVVTQYIHDTKIIREKGETIVAKVPVYITKEADSKCTVPAGFVRLFNDAADSGLPVAPTGPNASATAAAPKAASAASQSK